MGGGGKTRRRLRRNITNACKHHAYAFPRTRASMSRLRQIRQPHRVNKTIYVCIEHCVYSAFGHATFESCAFDVVVRMSTACVLRKIPTSVNPTNRK